MATGIREGKARFGDDVRERAKKAMEDRARAKERVEREPEVKAKPKAAAKPAPKKTAPKVDPKPIPKPTPKTAPMVKASPEVPKQPVTQTARGMERTSREPVRPMKNTTDGKKPYQFGPRTTGLQNVGTDKAATARAKMFEGNSPIGDLMEAMQGKKGTGGQMSRMKKGGMIKKGYKK
jgi:outer membrane biosynthesis protein TonB